MTPARGKQDQPHTPGDHSGDQYGVLIALARRLLRKLVPGPWGEDLVEELDLGLRQSTDSSPSSMAAVTWYWRRVLSLDTLRLRRALAVRRVAAAPRQRRRAGSWEILLTDLAYSARSLRMSPAFTVATVLTLAVAIGANTAVFSVVNGVLLKELPYEEPDRLVHAIGLFRGRAEDNLSEANFFDFRQQIHGLESIGAYAVDRRDARADAQPRRILVARTTASLLPLLGVEPLLGRTFTAAEDAPGASPTVILSYALWQRSFAGRSHVLSESYELSGIPHSIIGVMPAGFVFPTPGVEAWVPLQLDPANPWARVNHYLRVIGRLRPGYTLDAARAELVAYGERAVEEFPENYATFQFGTTAVGLLERQVGDVRSPLLLLLGSVGFVLLIACANVTDLMLVRSESRSGTIAVQLALGASRTRIIRRSILESLTLSAAGGVVGLAIAVEGVPALVALAADAVPRADQVSLDWRVLAFTAAASVLTGLLAGLFPALRMANADPRQTLVSSNSRTTGASFARGRRVMIVAEVALAVMLVGGAGITIRSLGNLMRLDVGFRTDHLLALRVDLPEREYTESAAAVALYRQLTERIEALPGVQAVGIAEALPLAGEIGRTSIQIDQQEVKTIGDAPVAQIQRASPGYFKALGLRLKAGRLLADTDVEGQPFVGIVNETFARQLLGGEPIGRRVRMFAAGSPLIEIVGVVQDVLADGLQSAPYPRLYVHYAQSGESAYSTPLETAVLVRSDGDLSSLADAVRAQVRMASSGAVVWDVTTMDRVRRAATTTQTFPAVLLSIFGAIALLLAAIGIYGVVSHTVEQRGPELAVRIALGATGTRLRRMVVAGVLTPVLVGLLLGLAGSVVTSRFLATLLYDVAPLDPLTHTAAAAVLAAVALLASYLPARRASRLEPTEALRRG